MASRTFIVFEDWLPRSPEDAAAIIQQEKGPLLYASSRHTLLDSTDKENIDPGTSQCPSPTTNKKRKNPLLSTKSHIPLARKGQVDSLEVKPAVKKRKSSRRGKPTSKKDGKAPVGDRKGSKQPSYYSPSLSPIDKERESEKEIERIRLADIEARCYHLTVKPLADLSEAFGCPQSFIGEGRAAGDDEMSEDKDYVFDLDPSDYLPPTPPTTPIKTSPKHTTSFSTPERELLFAAFSFSSPSPSSDRFRKGKSIGSGSACPSPLS